MCGGIAGDRLSVKPPSVVVGRRRIKLPRRRLNIEQERILQVTFCRLIPGSDFYVPLNRYLIACDLINCNVPIEMQLHRRGIKVADLKTICSQEPPLVGSRLLGLTPPPQSDSVPSF